MKNKGQPLKNKGIRLKHVRRVEKGAGGFRGSRGVQREARGPRGKGRGGKGGREFNARNERDVALAGRLISGSVWGCVFTRGTLEFLFAESDTQPIQSLGCAEYRSNAATSESEAVPWSRRSPPRLPHVLVGTSHHFCFK